MARLHPLDTRNKSAPAGPVHGLRMKEPGVAPAPRRVAKPVKALEPAPFPAAPADGRPQRQGPWQTARSAASPPDEHGGLVHMIRRQIDRKKGPARQGLSWLQAGIIVAAVIYVGIQYLSMNTTSVTADDLMNLFNP